MPALRVLSFGDAMSLRSFGPAVAHVSAREALRAGGGALLALLLMELVLFLPVHGMERGLFLIAPFGASAVMLFALPNSPLAQPWSVIVGNAMGALIGVALARSGLGPLWVVPLGVGLTLGATLLARALHPPAGAVAMTAALSPDLAAEQGYWFALTPVLIGSVFLVLSAMAYARATGRRYPFRQFGETGPNKTADPAAMLRLGLDEAELTAILERYRQSFNLGVKDLARLIGAAEMVAAGKSTGAGQASDIMSRDLVTLPPGASRAEAAGLFRRHGFTSIPVTEAGDRYLGVLFQIHLIEEAPGAGALAGRLLGRGQRVEALMSTTAPTAEAATPIAALLPLMAEGAVDAVPVLSGARIIGIVTRTDLIAALAQTVGRAA